MEMTVSYKMWSIIQGAEKSSFLQLHRSSCLNLSLWTMIVLRTHQEARVHELLPPSCGSLLFIQRLHRSDFSARTVGPWAYVFSIGLRDFAYAIPSMISSQALTSFLTSVTLPFQIVVEPLTNSSTRGEFFQSQFVAQLNIRYGISSSPRCLLAAGLSNVSATFWLFPCSWILFHDLAC